LLKEHIKMDMKWPTKSRLMSSAEYQVVLGVFSNTLPPPNKIAITDGAGLSGRAFTIPTSLVSAVFGIAPSGNALNACRSSDYLINVGADYDTVGSSRLWLLVHETTHVWQGKNSSFGLSYIFNSLYNQALYGSAAYQYTPGKPWKSYNVEQQATIVTDWFRMGQPPSGPLYPYIVNHVRKGDA
jgi:hypothetical protein